MSTFRIIVALGALAFILTIIDLSFELGTTIFYDIAVGLFIGAGMITVAAFIFSVASRINKHDD